MAGFERKGVAVSQIVYITIGIVVIAIVLWLLYTQTASGGKAVDANKCSAEKIRLCALCKFGTENYADCNPSSSQLTEFCGAASVNCEGENILPATSP